MHIRNLRIISLTIFTLLVAMTPNPGMSGMFGDPAERAAKKLAKLYKKDIKEFPQHPLMEWVGAEARGSEVLLIGISSFVEEDNSQEEMRRIATGTVSIVCLAPKLRKQLEKDARLRVIVNNKWTGNLAIDLLVDEKSCKRLER